MNPTLPSALSLVALTLFAGCAGTQLRSPDATPIAVSDNFIMGGEAVSPETIVEQWWTLFDDPTLVTLVERAVDANRDLAVAKANYDRARALIGEARGQRIPNLVLGGGGAYARPAGGPTDEFISATADLSWEVDLFGRVTNQIRAARADAESAKSAYDAVRLAIIASTASAYAEACGNAQSLVAARNSLDYAKDTLRLTEVRAKVGAASPLDTARAAAQAETLSAVVPALEARHKAALLALTTLIGEPPSAIPGLAAQCTAVPQVKQIIPVGDGAAMLERRPDVRQATSELNAAAARVGVAATDLIPRVTIGGMAQTSATNTGDLFQSATSTFSVGPLISWTFPNITAARARLKAAEATNRGALANYEGTILSALSETETALNNYQRGLERRAALGRASDQAKEAARIVRLRYDAGRENFLSVLDAERTWATAEIELAQAETDLAQLQVNLFRALGGGWQIDENATQVAEGQASGGQTEEGES